MYKKNDKVKSVEKALDILQIFTAEKPQLSLIEICQKLNLPKSTGYRLLTTLQSKGFLEHDEHTGKYQLGIKFIQISNMLVKGFNLREKALPVMNELRNACGETINLYVKKNLDRVCIEQVEGFHLVRRFALIGEILPLYCGASGKLLLAYQSPEEIERVIGQRGVKAWTENTITNSEKLLAELETIRSQDYAYSNGEREEGVVSLAAPVRNFSGEVIAAICISGPASRIKEENVTKYTLLVKEAAKKISKNLGYIN